MKNPLHISVKSEIFSVLMIVLCLIGGAYFYNHFPDKVITHWNFQGEADGYSGKFFGSFGIPFIIIGMYLLLLVAPLLDPKRERYEDFQKVYNLFRMVFISFFTVIFFLTGLVNLGYNIPINYVLPGLVGLLMIVLGNFMGKIKKNWFLGIRTPWTLSSENVWNKTHRVGGYLFILFGIIIMITPFFGKVFGVSLFVGGLLSVTLGSFAYSYILFRKEKLEQH